MADAYTKGISDYIPYSSHITPEIIKIKGGSYLMCFKLKGVNYVGQPQEIIDSRVIQINNFINQLRAPYRYNLYIQLNCVRYNSTASLASFFKKDSFADKLNKSYNENVIESAPVIATDYYISVIYRPYLKIGKLSAYKTTKKEIRQLAKQSEEVLGRIKEQVLSYFSEYQVEILTTFENEQGVLFSEQLGFLSQLLNLSENTPVPVQRAQISEYLATATLSLGSSEIIKIENFGKTKYCSIITFSEYPEETVTGLLQQLLELPYEMIVTQSFVPIDKAEAKSWLAREYRRMQNTDDASERDLTDLQRAYQGVISDSFVLGEFYWSVTIIDEDIKILKQKLALIDAVISSAGFKGSVNKIAKLYSYMSNLPANIHLHPRKARVSSENSAQLLPFLKQNLGKKTGNAWGDAVAMLRTINDEVYYFNFHDPEKEDSTGKDIAGNTFISGATGTGKTVLLSFLLAQTQRYKRPPKIVMFDKDLGSSVFVRAMGGKYSQIKIGEPTGFNPFLLENTAENRTFLAQLIHSILNNLGDNQTTTASENREIEEAIEQIMRTKDKSVVDIEGFANLLPDGDNSVKQRLYQWTHGQYKWIFNNPVDNFSTEAHILGIDYTQFLDIEQIRTPILLYLFHRVQEMLDGTPLIITLDEAWKPLKDPFFQSYLEDKQRTIRKERGLLVFASQSPSDAYRGLSDAFLEQIATHIFLPNPQAKEAVYCGNLGLEQEEFELIKNLGKHSRQFLVRHQGSTAHCKLELRGVREVEVMSGSASKTEIADRIIAKYGDETDEWIEHYYNAIEKRKALAKSHSKQNKLQKMVWNGQTINGAGLENNDMSDEDYDYENEDYDVDNLIYDNNDVYENNGVYEDNGLYESYDANSYNNRDNSNNAYYGADNNSYPNNSYPNSNNYQQNLNNYQQAPNSYQQAPNNYQQSNYAEQQSNYAEQQGNYAEQQGNYAEQQGSYADKQSDLLVNLEALGGGGVEALGRKNTDSVDYSSNTSNVSNTVNASNGANANNTANAHTEIINSNVDAEEEITNLNLQQINKSSTDNS